MQTFDYLSRGGGIAGTAVAEGVRARDGAASVAIVGAEPHRLYSRVLLPHVLRGKVTEDKTFLRAESFYDDKRLRLFSGVAAVKADPASRQVTLAGGEIIGYSKALLIATGGAPRRLVCPGAAEADALYFQTLEDTRRIAEQGKLIVHFSPWRDERPIAVDGSGKLERLRFRDLLALERFGLFVDVYELPSKK